MELKSHTSPAYSPEELIHFRKLITERLVGITLAVEHNHESEPKFLEDVKSFERRTGEDKEELRKHIILNDHIEVNKNDLDAALVRLDNGTYGYCEWPDCGVIIPFVRLEAILQAKYCLRHEVEADKRKKH